MSGPQAVFSVHDVMPETMHAVEQILSQFSDRGRPLPALLVVPGRAWNDQQLQCLRAWEDAGAELVAHGWHHETTPKRLYHRLHSLLISRNVAEHLDLHADGICELMRRSRQWFVVNDLGAPDTYIPPAWALGLPRKRLRDLPYERVETLAGVWMRSGEGFFFKKLPLLGFEADTPLRASVLRFWNRRQQQRALRRGQPLRISIHPRDSELLLGPELRQVLDGDWQHLPYGKLPCPKPGLRPSDSRQGSRCGGGGIA